MALKRSTFHCPADEFPLHNNFDKPCVCVCVCVCVYWAGLLDSSDQEGKGKGKVIDSNE
uniref:Uncharacterized protein n=1 Tax=Octopus bimaculoides TaxID=37653 RepID=A0A0L8HKL8_OCTBM